MSTTTGSAGATVTGASGAAGGKKTGASGAAEESNAAGLDVVEQFDSYEDYLDSQLTPADLAYLEDEDMARQLVELGYRGLGDTIRREDFEARKRLLYERSNAKHALPKQLASLDKDLSGYPFLQALAAREELIRSGKMTTIVFIRDVISAAPHSGPNKGGYGADGHGHSNSTSGGAHKGQEVSGYIDLAHRLRNEDFAPYFDRRKKLLPRPSDLSYYNWDTQACTANSSAHYQVIADGPGGLLFKNKRDRKIINVNADMPPGDNTVRVELETSEYAQVVLFDHTTRRRV